MHSGPVLSIDLGGTKLLAALVSGGTILERAEIPTDRDGGPNDWLHQIGSLIRPWQGRYARAGVAVTGLVKDGFWQSLNPTTLRIAAPFALKAQMQALLNLPVTLRNDAQAATWGEYEYGAGQGRDMVFLTISTGIGGGVVLSGKLLLGRGGLAGSFGQILPLPDGGAARIEDSASGQWIASAAARLGHPPDARAVFAAKADWATEIIATSAARVARLCQNIQLMLDPEIIVIGGGIGLAQGYLTQVEQVLAHLPPLLRPALVSAALGKDAGVIGVAALADRAQHPRQIED